MSALLLSALPDTPVHSQILCALTMYLLLILWSWIHPLSELGAPFTHKN